MIAATVKSLLVAVRACSPRVAELPQGVRPVLQFHENARVLIASQALSLKVHTSGILFNDASGIDCVSGWV